MLNFGKVKILRNGDTDPYWMAKFLRAPAEDLDQVVKPLYLKGYSGAMNR